MTERGFMQDGREHGKEMPFAVIEVFNFLIIHITFRNLEGVFYEVIPNDAAIYGHQGAAP